MKKVMLLSLLGVFVGLITGVSHLSGFLIYDKKNYGTCCVSSSISLDSDTCSLSCPCSTENNDILMSGHYRSNHESREGDVFILLNTHYTARDFGEAREITVRYRFNNGKIFNYPSWYGDAEKYRKYQRFSAQTFEQDTVISFFNEMAESRAVSFSIESIDFEGSIEIPENIIDGIKDWKDRCIQLTEEHLSEIEKEQATKGK